MEEAAEKYYRVQELSAEGSYNDAINQINEIIKNDTTHIPYLVTKVDLLIAKKMYLEALITALAFKKLLPICYEGYISLSVTLQFLHRYYNSLTVIERGLNLFPDNQDLKHQYDKVKQEYKKKQESAMEFEGALSKLEKQEQEMLHWNISAKLYTFNVTTKEVDKKTKEKIEEIIDIIDKAILLYPFSVDYYMTKTKCQFLLNQFSRCINHVNETIGLIVQITDCLFLSSINNKKEKKSN
jgi:tetratricopeptide (TPR) repeat protein